MTETKRPKTLAPVHPNAGIEADYRKRLGALVAEMNASVLYWVSAAYRATPPEMAQDASPAEDLRRAFDRLARRWTDKFADLAPKLARHFATAATKRADGALAGMLKEAGFTVSFKMTTPVNDVFRATLAENVALIKSIPAQYLTQVQGAVMRSVQVGRDLGSLTKEIQQQYGKTFKRAAFIARSQNNIATATITRARQTEIGVTKAIWLHSGAGKHPRPEHVKASGKTYDVAKGMFLEGVWTWPGREPNCRCVCRSVIPGLRAE